MAIQTSEILLDSLTADPVSPTDGCLWYRSDTKEFKRRRNGVTEVITIGGGSPSDMAGLMLERTTDLAVTGTYQEMTFDTTSLENDAAVLEHNNTNTERAEIKTNGLHQLAMSFNVDNGANLTKVLEAELRVNGTMVKQLDFEVSKSAQELVARILLSELVAGTYLTVAFRQQGGGTDLTLKANSIVSIIKLQGTKGDTGATGIAGADGDMTWEGNWVSQNYTANQAVKYTDGNSYVCHTNTVSSEVPTNATYWDVLAEKGDQGNSQSRIDISVHPHNDWVKNTSFATYVKQAAFLFAGTTKLGTPTKMYTNSFQTSAGNGQVRIYDLTNSLVICESASITSTSEGNIVDLGTISNLPTGQAVWSIENKGDGTNINNISSVSIEF